MTLREFHNGLRLLRSIDFHEIEYAMTREQWPSFRADPYKFFIICDDDTAAAIWAVMEARTKK